MGPICENCKTVRSIDLATVCPKYLAGHPCSYCYRWTAWRNGWHAKLIHERIPYSGEVLRLRQTTIDRLNAVGGCRLFSFGDYIPWMDEDLERIFDDAERVGLLIKAITKQPAFVHKFHSRVHIINVSVDALGEGVPHNVARALRETYPNVFVRAAIMSYQDLKELAWADILTLNHATNGYHRFNNREKQAIARDYPGKVCCVTGYCETCEVLCGAPLLASGHGHSSFDVCQLVSAGESVGV